MKIEGAIFDLDGTLMDSMYVWDNIGVKYLISNGKTPEPDASQKLSAMSLKQSAAYFRDNYGLDKSIEQMMNDINKIVEKLYFEAVVPKDGVIAFLDFLKDNGTKMCIATATDKYMVLAALERNNMRHYFSEVFTCTEVGAGKDEPLIFNTALDHLKTAKENTYIFEDAVYSVRTAKKAGFKVAGIYDVSEPMSEEMKELSDIYVYSMNDAKKYFE